MEITADQGETQVGERAQQDVGGDGGVGGAGRVVLVQVRAEVDPDSTTAWSARWARGVTGRPWAALAVGVPFLLVLAMEYGNGDLSDVTARTIKVA